VGALLIRMLDTKNLDPQTDDGARMLWLGTMDGILTGSSVAIEKRVLDGIIQMYEQSPYISKTGQ
jgi:hypothetical protein